MMRLSKSTYFITGDLLLDAGYTYGDGEVTHAMTLHRAAKSGALVFGAGTIQWSWGLDPSSGLTQVPSMQQATINLFADMDVQPTTLQTGMTEAVKSTDVTPPASAITAPASGRAVAIGSSTAVVGTAADAGGGKVGGVEVSADGGTTWFRADGRESWTWVWRPTQAGEYTLLSRAVDDSGNLETELAAGVVVTATAPSLDTCTPCTIFGDAVPLNEKSPDQSANELGVKFASAYDGDVTGIRFYKHAGSEGPFTGSLWDATTKALLAKVQFPELAASAEGWQSVSFDRAVSIQAGVTYIASYFCPQGGYAFTNGGFASPYIGGVLTGLQDTTESPNGVFNSRESSFPTEFFNTNYWVDVEFVADSPPTVVARLPAVGATSVAVNAKVIVTFSEPVILQQFLLTAENSGNVGWTVSVDATVLTFTPVVDLAVSTKYTVTVLAKDSAGNPLTTAAIWTFTTKSTTNSNCPCSIFDITLDGPLTDYPSRGGRGDQSNSDFDGRVQLGMRFRSTQSGVIKGVRFYKAPNQPATPLRTVYIWDTTSTAAPMATAITTSESTSGWQTAMFDDQGVSINANTVYIVSYYCPDSFMVTRSFFTTDLVSGPLIALADGINGAYRYSDFSDVSFPDGWYSASNYWVDPIFDYE